MLQAVFARYFPIGSLWRDRDFMLLFSATTLSLLGTAVTHMALPLTAVQLLGATGADMGILVAFQSLPFIVLGLPAGVLIDRSRKKRLAALFDIFAAIGLSLVPIAYLGGFLSMGVLYAAAFMVSTTEAIGGSSMQAFVTHLVGRERLVLANSKLFAASSAAMVAGPALGAALVSWVGAPLAITVDAASFLVSALLVWRISRESIPLTGRVMWRAQIKEGFMLVWRTPMLRAMVVVVCLWIALNDSFRALYVLRAARDLGIGAGGIALINMLGAFGGLAGAAVAHWIERRYGLRTALLVGIAVAAVGYGLYALPSADWQHVTWSAGLALLVVDCGATVYVVNYLSLRQGVTPDALLGRMVTTMRFLSIALTPLGTVSIGYAADAYGLTPTFLGLSIATALLAIGGALFLPAYVPLKSGASPS